MSLVVKYTKYFRAADDRTELRSLLAPLYSKTKMNEHDKVIITVKVKSSD